jgi:hypothetical protein
MKQYRDNAGRHVFQTVLSDSQNVTVESCTTSCASKNFTLAKLEHGVQCCTFYHQSIATLRFKCQFFFKVCGDKPVLDGASNVSDLDCRTGPNNNKV